MSSIRRAVIVVVVALAAVPIAACGSSKKSNDTSAGGPAQSGAASTVKKDAAVAALVPPAAKSKGTLTVASGGTYPPNEFIKDGRLAGWDPELATAIAQTMGLTPDIKPATFDTIIPGLAAGKYDISIDSFTDTKEREKTVDFVTYYDTATAFYVKAQGGPGIHTLADLCGHHVGATSGTTQATDAQAQSTKCKASGKKAVRVSVFPNENGANLALLSGRVDVGMADLPVVAYLVKQSNGQLKLSGQIYAVAPYGIAIPKKSGVEKPVLAAVKRLIATGKYKQILEKWGVQLGAISNPVINGAKS